MVYNQIVTWTAFAILAMLYNRIDFFLSFPECFKEKYDIPTCLECRVSLLCIDDLLLIDNACDDGDDLGDDRRSETN